jgi:hypothetical protein
VVAGLVGLLVVGWRYGEYATVWGDDPCRSRNFCDEHAIAVARRGLFHWYLGWAALTLLGVVAALVGRARHPVQAVALVRRPVMRPLRHVGLALARTLAWSGWLFATVVLWLFGGTPLLVAVIVVWLVGLTWSLDRLHRAAVPQLSAVATLLTSGAAAVATVVAAVAGAALVALLDVRWALLLPLGAVLAAVALVTAAARYPRPGSPALAVSATVIATLVCAVAVAVTEDGRGAVRSIWSDFHPDLPSATAAAAVADPHPHPPTNVSSRPQPTTRHTDELVKAERACGATDLTLTATGWDSAMGTSAVTVIATNRSATACWLHGHPRVRLVQGGKDLDLRVGNPTRGASGQPLTTQRVAMAQGEHASFGWWWQGYRRLADQQTPQTVIVSLTDGGQVRLELTDPRHLLDVVQGAAVDVTPWQ